VLAIALYRGASTRSEIDRIRGVNSTTALRNLLLRGLFDRIPNPKDERQHLYRATTAALAHLGFSRVEDIPDYEKTREEISLLEEKLRVKSGIPETTS
jgi:chromosome segregation and condensation protein ScpB